jgi:hypothetical protein
MPRVTRGLVFESYGVVAEAGSDDPELADILPALLPPGWRIHDGEPSVQFGVTRDGLVTRNGRRVARVEDDQEQLAARFSGVVRHYVALHAVDRVFVHAGVVGIGDTALVLPGQSHSGKTTLVAALLAHGATYYSDEYAVVRHDGTIEPYSKPLSIREPGTPVRTLGRATPVPIERIATEPVDAGLVVVTRFHDGARWKPKELSRGEGVLALLRNTVAARSRPEAAIAAVSALVSGTAILQGRRGDADDLAPTLLELLAERADPVSPRGADRIRLPERENVDVVRPDA